MRLNPLSALALAVFLWECVVAQNTCTPQTSCNGCLFVKDLAGITICGWCRNPNITSEGFCNERTVAAVGECTGSVGSEQLLVLDSSNCQMSSNQNTLIAAVAGSVGGVLFAVVAIYIYYRKKKQKQERLATFRRRELEMHRSRKLKLDKELGMQSGAANINQRQLAMSNSALQMSKSGSASQLSPSNSTLQIKHGEEKAPPAYDEAPAFPEPEIPKTTRRRFKCMSKGGLRVRESPNSDSAKVGGIKFEVVVTALSVKGNWVQVSANGWAMITSDDGSKTFLKELGEDEADDGSPDPEVVVG